MRVGIPRVASFGALRSLHTARPSLCTKGQCPSPAALDCCGVGRMSAGLRAGHLVRSAAGGHRSRVSTLSMELEQRGKPSLEGGERYLKAFGNGDSHSGKDGFRSERITGLLRPCCMRLGAPSRGRVVSQGLQLPPPVPGPRGHWSLGACRPQPGTSADN
jgi:hypothetical protein